MYKHLVKNNAVKGVAIILLIFAMIGITKCTISEKVYMDKVHSECVKTELLARGNKGHWMRIYDCAGVDL